MCFILLFFFVFGQTRRDFAIDSPGDSGAGIFSAIFQLLPHVPHLFLKERERERENSLQLAQQERVGGPDWSHTEYECEKGVVTKQEQNTQHGAQVRRCRTFVKQGQTVILKQVRG